MHSSLTLTCHHLEEMIRHAAAQSPLEACGLLAGRGARVESVLPITNAAQSPAHFRMDPLEQLRAFERIESSGLDLVGIFHSHPGGRAYPSAIDVEKAYWPGTNLPNYPDVVYVIVSLMDRESPVVRGFSIVDGTVREVPVSVL